MQHNDGNSNTISSVTDESNVLERARDLARREQNVLSSNSTPLYLAASLGQTPYVALADGAISVEPKQKWMC